MCACEKAQEEYLVCWKKLFWIDILLYKNKTSLGTLTIFVFLTLLNSTHGKIFSRWSRNEDLHYSIYKLGNEITKVRKITWLLRKTDHMFSLKTNMLLCLECCDEFADVFMWIWQENGRKTLGQSTAYLVTEIQHFVRTFVVWELFLWKDRSSFCFEDGNLLLTLCTSHKMLLY